MRAGAAYGEEAALKTPSGEWFCGESKVVSLPGMPLSEVAIYERSPDGEGWVLVPNPFTSGGFFGRETTTVIGNGPPVGATRVTQPRLTMS